MADLAGVRAKLRRADEHRLAYDELFESYLETHPYSILFEFDPETGWHVFRWVVVNEPFKRSRPPQAVRPVAATLPTVLAAVHCVPRESRRRRRCHRTVRAADVSIASSQTPVARPRWLTDVLTSSIQEAKM